MPDKSGREKSTIKLYIRYFIDTLTLIKKNVVECLTLEKISIIHL